MSGTCQCDGDPPLYFDGDGCRRIYGPSWSRIVAEKACRANLAVLGRAMGMYCAENGGDYPVAGAISNDYTSGLSQWASPDRDVAFTIEGYCGEVTMSSSLYLLVKTMEVAPESFLCYGESDVNVFDISLHLEAVADANLALTEVWDFGGENTAEHCSYAYHNSRWAPFALTSESQPTMAVMADRNPWCSEEVSNRVDWYDFVPDMAPFDGTSAEARKGNSEAHEKEGQNVLFVDGYVDFERRSFCAYESDNIYTERTLEGECLRGYSQNDPSEYYLYNRLDSLLLNDF